MSWLSYLGILFQAKINKKFQHIQLADPSKPAPMRSFSELYLTEMSDGVNMFVDNRMAKDKQNLLRVIKRLIKQNKQLMIIEMVKTFDEKDIRYIYEMDNTVKLFTRYIDAEGYLGVNQILEIDNWYELELRYDFLPPDIFPKLQVKLWNQQWNCCHEKVDDYEPDKGRIVFVQNNRLMMAYRYQNSIVLALRKKITEENNIENDGKEAIKKIREVLRDINISQKLEARNRETESKVQEYVVLMEQNDIRECKNILNLCKKNK